MIHFIEDPRLEWSIAGLFRCADLCILIVSQGYYQAH
jgi:hypothetical protein